MSNGTKEVVDDIKHHNEQVNSSQVYIVTKCNLYYLTIKAWINEDIINMNIMIFCKATLTLWCFSVNNDRTFFTSEKLMYYILVQKCFYVMFCIFVEFYSIKLYLCSIYNLFLHLKPLFEHRPENVISK